MSRADEPSDAAPEPAESVDRAAAVHATGEPESEHAVHVRRLADTMLRTALWPGFATVVIATVLAGVIEGLPGVLGALVGGVVAFASSLATIGLMRWSGGMPPMFVMVVALGGYVGKMLVLLVVMTLLSGVEGLHVLSLALTMLATIMVWAGAEVRGFQKAKIPTIVPAAGS